MTIGITIALNGPDDVTRRVLDYYAALSVPGAEFILHAVGSSDEDRAAAEGAGWAYDEAPNGNLGAKRNAGVLALHALCVDHVLRIGDDDMLSPALLAEIVRELDAGAGGVSIRGTHIIDEDSGECVYASRPEFTLAISGAVLERCEWRPYDETHAVPDRLMAARVRAGGLPLRIVQATEERPFVQIKRGKSINSFGRQKVVHAWEPADAGAIMEAIGALTESEEATAPKPKRRKRKPETNTDSGEQAAED